MLFTIDPLESGEQLHGLFARPTFKQLCTFLNCGYGPCPWKPDAIGLWASTSSNVTQRQSVHSKVLGSIVGPVSLSVNSEHLVIHAMQKCHGGLLEHPFVILCGPPLSVLPLPLSLHLLSVPDTVEECCSTSAAIRVQIVVLPRSTRQVRT